MMLLDNEVSAYIQAESRPLSRRFGREEGIENLRQMFRGDARATVLYFDHEPRIFPFCSDNQGSRPLHGVNPVVYEIRPNLV